MTLSARRVRAVRAPRRVAALLLVSAGLLSLSAALVHPASSEASSAGTLPRAVGSSTAPEVGAPGVILVQPDTADVVYGRADSHRRPMASTAKLMTVLLALERGRLSKRMTAVAYRGSPGESLVGLHGGERWSTADLIRGLLLASGNDAAATVAARVGGSQRRFVALMNRRARSAGLRHTRFADPIGLDPRTASSPADLAKLALLVRRNPFAREVMARPSATLRSGPRTIVVHNRNTLVGAVPWVTGVKTGHTQAAGYVLVGSGRRDGVQVVSVVMGASSETSRNADTLGLLRWGLARYRRAAPVIAGRAVTHVPVKDQDERVALVATRSVRIVVRRGEPLRTRLVGVPAELEGPLAKGARVGAIVAERRGRVIARVPLATASALERATLWERTAGLRAPLAALVLIALVAGGAASLTSGRGRRARRGRSRRSRVA